MSDLKKIIVWLFVSISTGIHVQAGLNKFTALDKFSNWTIERKIDSSSNEILCRASIISYGSWFSSRVRLNESDELIVPDYLADVERPSSSEIKRVKTILKRCREDFIYPFLE